MASLRQIRQRMKSIDSIHEITKAMEMISTFRFKRAETRYLKSKVYFEHLESLLANLADGAGDRLMDDPYFSSRKIRKKALLVISADKGLCGSYNSNLVRLAEEWLAANGQEERALIAIGKVSAETLRKRGVNVFDRVLEKPMPAAGKIAKELSDKMKNWFLTGQFDAIDILYASYHAGGAPRNITIPYLNLSYLQNRQKVVVQNDYIFEPDYDGVFKPLLERYLEGKMYNLLLESFTSEHAARLSAMKQATENGEEVLDDLTLLRNKTRQAVITRELSEIVSGASAVT